MITLIDYGAGNLHSLEGGPGPSRLPAHPCGAAGPGRSRRRAGAPGRGPLPCRPGSPESAGLVARGTPARGGRPPAPRHLPGAPAPGRGQRGEPEGLWAGPAAGHLAAPGPRREGALDGVGAGAAAGSASGAAGSQGRLALLRPQLCPGTQGGDCLHRLPRADVRGRAGQGGASWASSRTRRTSGPFGARAAPEGAGLDGGGPPGNPETCHATDPFHGPARGAHRAPAPR